MANKILNTRIQLRYDTYANWTSKNPKLAAGEVALVEIPSNDSTNNPPQEEGTGNTAPQVLMKVGDGKTSFIDLPWSSARSADVYQWAKKQYPKDAIGFEHSSTGKFVTGMSWNTDVGNKITYTTSDIAISDVSELQTNLNTIPKEFSFTAYQEGAEGTAPTPAQFHWKENDMQKKLAIPKVGTAHTADTADKADIADKATKDGFGNTIASHYATKTELAVAVSGAVQYWGIIKSSDELGKDLRDRENIPAENPDVGAGDFYRVDTNSTIDIQGTSAKAGDLIIANIHVTERPFQTTSYEVLRQENGDGTVTEVKTGEGLTGGPITTSGTLKLSPSTSAKIGGGKAEKFNDPYSETVYVAPVQISRPKLSTDPESSNDDNYNKYFVNLNGIPAVSYQSQLLIIDPLPSNETGHGSLKVINPTELTDDNVYLCGGNASSTF